MRSSILTLFALFLLASTYSETNYKVMVYPLEAIQDSARLPKKDFDSLYPGIDVTYIGLMDEGWYIRYTHEGLVYMFGPVDDLTNARLQKEMLEQIRLTVVLKNSKLSASTIDIIRFDFQFEGGKEKDDTKFGEAE